MRPTAKAAGNLGGTRRRSSGGEASMRPTAKAAGNERFGHGIPGGITSFNEADGQGRRK